MTPEEMLLEMQRSGATPGEVTETITSLFAAVSSTNLDLLRQDSATIDVEVKGTAYTITIQKED